MSKHEISLYFPEAHLGAEPVFENRQTDVDRTGVDPGYTRPERKGHYNGLYPWDIRKQLLLYAFASRQFVLVAVGEHDVLLSHQQDSGQIYNRIGEDQKRRIDLEGPARYGQPPLGGMAELAIYHGLLEHYSKDPRVAKAKATEVASRQLPFVAKEDLYYLVDRKNSDGDNLVYNIDTGETGRDEAPDFNKLYRDLDFVKFKRLPRKGEATPLYANLWNAGVAQYQRLMVTRQRNKLGDNYSLEAAREILSFNDFAFNCLLVFDAYMVAKLARNIDDESTAQLFEELGHRLEDQILSDWSPIAEAGRGMWNPDPEDASNGMFYSIMSNNERLNEVATIANAYGPLLPNASPDQVRSSLRLIKRMMAPKGLASVVLDSPECDYGYREIPSKWGGPHWGDQPLFQSIIMRTIINRADLQDYPDIIHDAKSILWDLDSISTGLLDDWANKGLPTPEFSHPFTGEGQRMGTVEHFTWPHLGRITVANTEPCIYSEALVEQSRGHNKVIEAEASEMG